MTAITALLLFAGWTLLLMFTYVGYRVSQMAGGKPADSWTRGRAAPSPNFIARAEHAHANCVENLPVFGAVVLSAHALGQSAVADASAMWVLFARIAQSVVHLIGVNHRLVIARAAFYTIQVVLILGMIRALIF